MPTSLDWQAARRAYTLQLMPVQQTNATTYNPNDLDLTRVAEYERVIRAPLERVWENVLDWEHLPHLHASSFDHIALDDLGDWGWRTWSDPEHSSHVELCVADERRYVARSYRSGQQVSEIWTTLEPRGDQTAITVEFSLANVEADNADALGQLMLTLYTRLWDEDESMMRERHRRLQESRSDETSVRLGNRDELAVRLRDGEQIVFQLRKREYQLRLRDDALITHPTICPHLLGPLTDADISGGTLRCPWHGYKFDLETGACLSPRHADCKLPAAAEVLEEDGILFARA